MNTINESGIRQLIAEIYAKRSDAIAISPSWLATEALLHLDPRKKVRKAQPMIYIACHLQFRQVARSILAQKLESDERADDTSQHEIWPELQKRYPIERKNDEAEPIYIRLEYLSEKDRAYNIARMRKTAKELNKHADALEAWSAEHPPLAASA